MTQWIMAILLLAALLQGCGRYGPPVRVGAAVVFGAAFLPGLPGVEIAKLVTGGVALLIAGEFFRVGIRQIIQFLGHCRVLVGGRLELHADLAPGTFELVDLLELLQCVRIVRQQQTEPGHVLRGGMRLESLNVFSKRLAVHDVFSRRAGRCC